VTDLDAYGISVSVPPRWEGRVFRRPRPNETGATSADGDPASPGETTNAVVHISTVPLAPGAADFASDAVMQLGEDDALLVLFEYDPSSVQQPLFAARGIPRSLDPDEFSPNALQRSVRGQAGVQRFFQESDRAFCLYVVLGSFARRHQSVSAVNGVLASLQVAPRGVALAPSPPSSREPHSILDRIASSADLTTLAGLLASGDTRALLEGSGPFTMFAPDDEAFASVDLTELRQDPVQLARTLQHHIVAGAESSKDLARTTSVAPLVGEPVPVAVASDGQIVVGGAPIVRADVDATNGYVHVITGVLELPK
jgi:uncharacterized surface protein with fasciclin (FAS1) repeats